MARATTQLTPNVDLLAIGSAEEPYALRAMLEAYGARVALHPIGQAAQLADALAGRSAQAEYLLISCHGDRRGIVLPALAPDIAATQPFLEETAPRVMPPSVSLVKTIGDAVMLVCPKPEPLIDGLLALVQATRQLGSGLPQLRAGIAAGAAIERAGDWYGETVNLASRITGVVPPDAVVATEDVWRAAPDEVRLEGRRLATAQGHRRNAAALHDHAPGRLKSQEEQSASACLAADRRGG